MTNKELYKRSKLIWKIKSLFCRHKWVNEAQPIMRYKYCRKCEVIGKDYLRGI